MQDNNSAPPSPKLLPRSESSNPSPLAPPSPPFTLADPGSFSLLRSFHLADFFTLANGACGFLSIWCCLLQLVEGGWLDLAVGLLPLGVIFDVLDGRIARWRRHASILGQELDSLADLISFALAPAVFAFVLEFRNTFDLIILTGFVCCALARLARFNASRIIVVKKAELVDKTYRGFPVPLNILLVLGLYAYRSQVGIAWPWQPVPLLGSGLRWGMVGYALMAVGMVSHRLVIPKL